MLTGSECGLATFIGILPSGVGTRMGKKISGIF
jgi:hypothetical protein